MKKICFLLTLLPLWAWGQRDLSSIDPKNISGITVLKETDRLFALPWNLSRRTVLDTAQLTVLYYVEMQRDTLREERERQLHCLQVGRCGTNRYFSVRQELDDLHSTNRKNEVVKDAFTDWLQHLDSLAGRDIWNGEILTVADRERCERLHDYQKAQVAVVLREAVDRPQWEIDPEAADTLGGYLCRQASARYRGRTWRVWFAPEIPVTAGPWKLGGLPGLILQAEDSRGHYCWRLAGLFQRTEPICRCDVAERLLDAKRFTRYVRSAHEAPTTLFGDGGKHIFISKKGQKMQVLDETWTIPYNPIERE